MTVDDYGMSLNEGGRDKLNVIDVTPIVHHHDGDRIREPPDDQTTNDSLAKSIKDDIESIAEAWPGWYLVKDQLTLPIEVTSANKLQYVQAYITWLTFASVAPQWHAFKTGFFSIIDQSTFGMLTARDLHSILEGSTHLDIAELRRVTEYDGFDSKSKYIQCFWRLVASWSEEKQKQLLKFVTAAERIPAGGASNITFKIQRAMPESLDHLPTSSTCFGTLLLPKYASVEILEKKLSAAIKYGMEGFGTG